MYMQTPTFSLRKLYIEELVKQKENVSRRNLCATKNLEQHTENETTSEGNIKIRKQCNQIQQLVSVDKDEKD